MTETTRPRANRGGHQCPPWCQTDHEEVHGTAGTFGFHGGAVARIEADGRTSVPDEIITRAFHPGDPRWDEGPVVSVSAIRRGAGGADPHIWLSPDDAGQLADILSMIGDWDQFGRLTAAIRRAAAQATEDSHGLPSRLAPIMARSPRRSRGSSRHRPGLGSGCGRPVHVARWRVLQQRMPRRGGGRPAARLQAQAAMALLQGPPLRPLD